MESEKEISEMDFELKKYKTKITELNSLLRSMELINSSLDLNSVLDKLMELAKQITNAEASSALLLENDKLCFRAASGLKSAEVKKVYLNRGEGIAGWVLENGLPLLIKDVTKDNRFSQKTDASSGFITRSIIAVPLKMEDKIIGVIESVNKADSSEFQENDIDLLSSLAVSAAMAIHKAQLYGDLNELFLSTIKVLANAIEAKDLYTRGHSERIREYSMLMAKEMKFSDSDKKNIEIAALLHDVGKIGISEAVLRKTGRLTEDEYNEIKKHPVIGAEMLSSIKQMGNMLPSIRYHQEHFNGCGYPEGLSGNEIPLFARIIAVVDTFDAMTSDRPYRNALPHSEAIQELERCSGKQFDPDCVKTFITVYNEFINEEKEETE